MTADVLREAARLMRNRAAGCVDDSWYTFEELPAPVIAHGDRCHIASWHPAVALAVANWLDYAADIWDIREQIGMPTTPHDDNALSIANAYLGRTA